MSKEEIEALPEEEKLVAKRLKLGYVLGKGDKKVPSRNCICYKHNDEVQECSDIKPKQSVCFGHLHKNSMKNMRGLDAVRMDKAGLQNSSLITATQVRKYLSTTLQLKICPNQN